MLKEFKFRFRFVIAMLVLCFILLAFVYLTATTAKVQYEINKVDKEIAEVEKDIRVLQVKIKTASNITNIEARAQELGLVYPSFEQVKYLKHEGESIPDLALALMETAYH